MQNKTVFWEEALMEKEKKKQQPTAKPKNNSANSL